MKMRLDFKKMDGLIPAVVQDLETKQVLMLGFINREALSRTLRTGKVTFWSRTKKRLWVKGETSGNFLFLRKAYVDCDRDTILFKVKPVGPVCHTGKRTCFSLLR